MSLEEKYGPVVPTRFPKQPVDELAFLDSACQVFSMNRSEVIRTGVPSLIFLYQFHDQVEALYLMLHEFVSNIPRGSESMITKYDFVVPRNTGKEQRKACNTKGR